MFKYMSVAIFIFLPALAGVQDDAATVDKILERLESANGVLTSFTAHFTQTEIDEFGDEVITTGEINFLKPGRYRLTSKLDGEVYEEIGKNPDAGWRIRHRVKKIERFGSSDSGELSGGLSLSGGVSELRETYEITLIGKQTLNSGTAYHLECIPRVDAGNFDPSIIKMELWINVDAPAPVTRVFLSKRDDITQDFVLDNIRRDVTIDKNMFIYRVPRGYDEIRH